MANEYQFDSIAVEVVRDGPSDARFASISIEVVRDGPSDARFASIGIEVVRSIEAGSGSGRRRLMMGS